MTLNVKIVHIQLQIVKSCGRKGIPESMRYLIWPRLAEVEELKKTHEFYYEQYLEVEEYEQKESIQKD